jgi:hypothetical protein
MDDVGARDDSDGKRMECEPGLFEALGVDHEGDVAHAIEVVRDSLDAIDPALLALSTPTRRISTVPAIRARISLIATHTLDRPRPRASDPLAFDPADHQDADGPARRRVGPRAKHPLRWAAALAVSVVTGGLVGRATRPHAGRATAVHVATIAVPVATALARVGAPSSTAPSVPVASPAVAPEPTRMDIAPEEIPEALEQNPASANQDVGSLDPPDHHRHHRSRSLPFDDSPSPTAAESAASLDARATALPGAAAVSRRSEPSAISATPPGASSDCAARCHGDLSCAADCVVHGAQVARAAETPENGESSAVRESTVPMGPPRAEVARALESIRGAMRACAGNDERTALVTITFASSGRVTTAVTEAPYAGTPAGSCMARAARAASVSPFTRATFAVRAPFAMH